MKERLDKLLTVKSIVTLLLALIFCIITLKGTISGQEFLTVFSIVIAFYYGTQSAKKETTAAMPESTVPARDIAEKPPDTGAENAGSDGA